MDSVAVCAVLTGGVAVVVGVWTMIWQPWGCSLMVDGVWYVVGGVVDHDSPIALLYGRLLGGVLVGLFLCVCV